MVLGEVKKEIILKKMSSFQDTIFNLLLIENISFRHRDHLRYLITYPIELKTNIFIDDIG
jgi:hypothetical protein